MSRLPPEFPLTTGQQGLAATLATELLQTARKGFDALRRAPPGSAGRIPALKMPRWPNAHAILGARGAGKTALILATLDALEAEARARQGENPAPPRLRILEPIDLSLAPPCFPESVVVIQRLRGLLKGQGEAESVLAAECREAFERVVAAAFRGVDGYEQMLQDTAVSPQHYLETASEELDQRLHMPALLAAWLDKEAERAGVDTFVVTVDDVDLAPGDHAPLVWSLVDELHQPRLVLLLAGQLDRIEEALAGRLDQQRKIADEVLLKVLPDRTRLELIGWPLPERPDFRRRRGGPTLEQVLGGCGLSPWLVEATRALLPPLPRGLEAVYELAAARQGAGDTTWQSQLWLLAHARGEVRLAARLKRSSLALLGAELDFPPAAGRRGRTPVHELELGARVGRWAQAETDGVPLDEAEADAGCWQFLLLDAALAAGEFAPLDLVLRVPAVAGAWAEATPAVELSRAAVQDALERVEAATQARAVAASWAWVALTLDEQAHDGFRVYPGPRAVLEAFHARSGPIPTPILRSQFGLDARALLAGVGEDAAHYLGEGPLFPISPLPVRARLSLLVVIELARFDRRWFEEPNVAENLVDLARCSAGVFLGGLARLAVRAAKGPEPTVFEPASRAWIGGLVVAAGRLLLPSGGSGAFERPEPADVLAALRAFRDLPTEGLPPVLPDVGRRVVLEPSEWRCLHETIEGMRASVALRHLVEG